MKINILRTVSFTFLKKSFNAFDSFPIVNNTQLWNFTPSAPIKQTRTKLWSSGLITIVENTYELFWDSVK